MMTNVERFDWAMQVADPELIAEAARPYLESDGLAQMVAQNVLLFPSMLATLRRFDFDDVRIGLAMLEPTSPPTISCRGWKSPMRNDPRIESARFTDVYQA